MIDVAICILIVYLVYYFVSVNRYDKTGHVKKKEDKNSKKVKIDKNRSKVEDYMELPSEVKYFVKKYNVDLDKINLRGLLKLTGFVLGIDITIVTIFVLLVLESVVWQVVVASILIIPIYLISLKFLGKYFKKKGLIKDV